MNELIEEAKSIGLFKRDKKSLEIKIIAGLLYFLGLSLRKTSQFLSIFEEISHESVRIYYHKLKVLLNEPVKKERWLIAVDETKIKVNGKYAYVWSAIDVDTKECLAIWVSDSRTSFHAYV